LKIEQAPLRTAPGKKLAFHLYHDTFFFRKKALGKTHSPG
jgi:hypothetical protein